MRYIKDRQTKTLLGLAVLLVTGILIGPWLWQSFRAEIIYVRPVATGAGNGSSWEDATTLRDALQNRARAEVWIAAGTHYPIVPDDLAAVTDDERDISFRVSSGVVLYGGFAGTEMTRDQRDPAVNLTVLSGDIDQNDELDAGNSRTVVNLSGTNATTVLDGLTITGGNADAEESDPRLPSNAGGGIFNIGGSPTLTNVQITGNAARFGSGIYITTNSGRWGTASQPTFSDVVISDNTGSGVSINGGSRATFTNAIMRDNGHSGVYIGDASHATFTDVTISNNGGNGATIERWSDATFTDVTINNNAGGGMEIWYGSNVIFTNGVLSNNGQYGVRLSSPVAAFGDHPDGGVTIDAPSSEDTSRATFTDVTIRDNSWDGVLISGPSHATFSDATISNNAGSGVDIDDGGRTDFTNVAISDNGRHGLRNLEGGDLSFTNGIVSGNAGAGVENASSTPAVFTGVRIIDNDGGGVTSRGGSPIFRNVTISGNQAEHGGGVVIHGGSPTFINATISGNQAEQGGGIYARGNDSDLTLTNVTISGNLAEQGGGVYTRSSDSRIRNTIIWGNATGDAPQVVTGAGSLLTFASTLVQGVDLTGEGSGNLDGTTDPQFVAPVAPEQAPTSAGDYRLYPGSALMDAGDPLFLDETQDNVPDLNGDGDEDDILSAEQDVGLGALELTGE